jgi:hypothetical protein
MGEEAHMPDLPTQAPTKPPGAVERVDRANSNATTDVEQDQISIDERPMSSRNFQNPFSRVQTSLDMDDYFVRINGSL